MCDNPEVPLEKMCDPCSVEGKKEESTNFCANCLEYFCINCAKDHRKYKQSRDHIILEELPSDTTIYESLSTFSRCRFHPEIDIEKFCKLHDEMICRYCLKDMHNACDDVVDIEDCEKGEIEEIPQTLVELKNEYLKQKMILDMHLDELDINKSEVKENIMAYVQKVRDVADRVERSLNETLDSLVSPLNDSLKQAIENIENSVKKVNEFQTFHHLLKNHNSKKDKYILRCNLSELLKDSGKVKAIVPLVSSQKVRMLTPVNTNKLITELSKCDIGFSSTTQLSIEKCSDEDNSYGSCYNEVKTVGLKTSVTINQLQCTLTELKHEQSTQVDTSVFGSKLDQGVQVTEDDLRYYKHDPLMKFMFLHNERTFATQREDDVIHAGPSNIGTLEVFSDGRILLIDRGQNIIKLFSPDLTLSSWMLLESEQPRDMCIVGGKEENVFTVAVCFDGLFYLHIIEYDKDFETKRMISCYGTVLSITVITSDILVLYQIKDGKCQDYAIQVINHTNKVTRFHCNVPRKMLTNSGYKIRMHDLIIIRACSVVKRIILAANDEVYVFNISDFNSIEKRLQNMMQCDWFYKRTGFTNLTTVSVVKTDVEGNIYICDHKSGIHQISTQSCRDSRILLNGNKNISSLAIDMAKGRFFIIYGQTSCVRIFQLW